MIMTRIKAGCVSFSSRWAFLFLIPAFVLLAGCPRAEEEDVVEPEPVEPPVAEEGEGHLQLRTLYAEGGPEADDARYSVESADGETVSTRSRRASFDLEAGTYRVTAMVGNAEATAEAQVRPDERTELDLVLEAGVLELGAVLVEDGPPAEGARFQILSTEKDIRGARESIVTRTRRTSFILPEGTYLVRADEGLASAETEVEIKAGDRTETAIALDAGLLHVAVVEEDGSEVSERVRWTILSAEEDLRGQRETITGPTSRDQFILSSGQYLLQARAADRTAQKDIEIKAGERLDVEMTLPSAGEETAGD